MRSFGSGSDRTHFICVQDQRMLGPELTDGGGPAAPPLYGREASIDCFVFIHRLYVYKQRLLPQAHAESTPLRSQAPLGGSCALGPTYSRDSAPAARKVPPDCGLLVAAWTCADRGELTHVLKVTETNSDRFSGPPTAPRTPGGPACSASPMETVRLRHPAGPLHPQVRCCGINSSRCDESAIKISKCVWGLRGVQVSHTLESGA